MAKNPIFLLLATLVALPAAWMASSGCDGGSLVDASDASWQNPEKLVAAFSLTKSKLKVSVDASEVAGNELEDNATQVRWDWTDDGVWDTEFSQTKTASYEYPQEGEYTIRMEVKDMDGNTDTCTRKFTLTQNNESPTAAFAVNMVNGMIASVDASSSSDIEDPTEDLLIRWDFDGDGTYDTDWSTSKTTEHTYEISAEYTIKLQVKDLNGATDTATETIIASPIEFRSCFLTYHSPYLIKLNFRLINKVTNKPVSPEDTPALQRSDFKIFEDGVLIDSSETSQLLTRGSRPMHLALVLDYTGSMYNAGGIDEMVSAAKQFIDSQGRTTYISLWAFWERQGGNKEIADFTQCNSAGKQQLKDALDAFTSEDHDRGATEIWDLLAKVAQEKFLSFDNGVSRAIVFLSDGHDTTSQTSVSQLIKIAFEERAISFFPIGLAFRPEDYPDDEPDLKEIAQKTNGTYFTVNQVEDLSTVFTQMAEDFQCDWILSYVTLQSSGTHKVEVECNYLDGLARIEDGKFRVDEHLQGNIKKTLLSVQQGDSSASQTEYIISAEYVGRNMNTFKIRIADSQAPAEVSLYQGDSLCPASEGWTITQDGDGWYTISNDSVLEYGSFGKIARCTVQSGDLPWVVLELPSLAEQGSLYDDGKMVMFEKTDDVTLRVPTIVTGVTSTAENGTPADPNEASANAHQLITVTGQGLSIGDYLIIMTIDNAGDKSVSAVSPDSVAADGSSADYQLPYDVCTGQVYVWDDYTAAKYLLQIVPHIKVYYDSYTKYSGTGFIEGGMTAVVNGVQYLDNGPEEDDGIDVTGTNTAFQITTSYDTTQPIYVVTEGGTSETYVP